MNETKANEVKAASFMRRFAAPKESFDLGIDGDWSWTPSIYANLNGLECVSPTTEYSTENGE